MGTGDEAAPSTVVRRPSRPLYAVIEIGQTDGPGVWKASRSGEDYALLDVAGPWGVVRLSVNEEGEVEVMSTKTLPWRKADIQDDDKWRSMGTWKLS